MPSLLTPDDYDDLPVEPKAKWIALERIARKRLEAILSSDENAAAKKLTTLQYMKTISAAAKSTGVEAISFPTSTDPATQLDRFLTEVEAATAVILLEDTVRANDFGIKIASEPKQQIRELVVLIQDQIDDLLLPPREEKRLREALIAFSSELEAPRSRFAIGSAQLIVALTILNLSVSSVAVGDEALKNIQSVQTLWGVENEKAEAEKLGIPYQKPIALLEPPRKKIEVQKTSK